jgi:hypothetical protein
VRELTSSDSRCTTSSCCSLNDVGRLVSLLGFVLLDLSLDLLFLLLLLFLDLLLSLLLLLGFVLLAKNGAEDGGALAGL